MFTDLFVTVFKIIVCTTSTATKAIRLDIDEELTILKNSCRETSRSFFDDYKVTKIAKLEVFNIYQKILKNLKKLKLNI